MNDEFDEFFYESGDEQDPLEMAQIAFQRNELAEAVEYAEAWLEEHPLDVEALHVCAPACAGLGDDAQALALYRKALSLAPGHGLLHHNIGALLEKRKHYDQALHHLRQAMALQPDFPETYINLGNVLDAMGQGEEALRMYREALRRLPDTADVYFNLGCTLNRLGRFQEALASFRTVLTSEPGSAAALNGQGLALAGLGRGDEAVAALSAAVEAAPEAPLYRYNRALALRSRNRLQDALDDLDEVLRIDPCFLEAFLQKAEIFQILERWQESRRMLAAAEECYPAHPDILCCRGLLLKNQGSVDDALAALNQSLEKAPDHRKALSLKGLLLMEMGSLEEAVSCFNRVLEQGDNPDIAYRRACIYARQGQIRKAAQSLGQAAARDPGKLLAAKTDEAFDAVRETPSFRRLFKKFHLL